METKKFLTKKQRFKQIRARHLTAFRRYISLKGSASAIEDYLSMNAFELREHFEALWLDGMDWDSYGTFWVVDHIVALKYFDPTNINDMKLCWHHSNLVPAYWNDNHAKGYAPEISAKMLLQFPQTPTVQRLLEKSQTHVQEFENYYQRINN